MCRLCGKPLVEFDRCCIVDGEMYPVHDICYCEMEARKINESQVDDWRGEDDDG